MKEYILLVINIAFTIGLFIFAHSPQQQYVKVGAQIECMSVSQNKQLCAQCFTRSAFIDPLKGYVVNSTSEYAGLKFIQKQELLSCKQSLHLVDYSDVNAVSIVFERQQVVGQLLSELDASVIFAKKGKTTIQPKFQSFIIFGWYDSIGTKGVSILMPNDEANKSLFKLFFKLLNVFIFILIVGKIFMTKAGNEKQRAQENKLVNYLIITLVIVLQLLTSSYTQKYSHVLLCLARIIFLSLPVLRVEVRTSYILIYSLLGLLMVWHQLTLAVYSYIGWLLILIGGWDKLNVEPIWRYSMVSQLIISINYLVWYLIFQYQADSALMIIELSQILVTLLALGLVQNRNVQRFRQYIPSDQKPIYLSGYDQEQEMVVRT